jgi:hypothetical protein
MPNPVGMTQKGPQHSSPPLQLTWCCATLLMMLRLLMLLIVYICMFVAFCRSIDWEEAPRHPPSIDKTLPGYRRLQRREQLAWAACNRPFGAGPYVAPE